MTTKHELLAAYPPARHTSAEAVRRQRQAVDRPLVVLDDDPTGTQSVADLPVLTGWDVADLQWALGTGASAVYVMTNARSMSAAEARRLDAAVVDAALDAAANLGLVVDFVSRADSTLRGHYPLETDVITERLATTGRRTDAVILVPAFPEAGRITVGGVHYASDEGEYVPVGRTEFARDATFSYTSSDMREWVVEKSAGRYSSSDVQVLPLEVVRAGADAVVQALSTVSAGQPVVADAADEMDLRTLALGLLAAQRAGKEFVYRAGPPFVRALIGQVQRAPLTAGDLARLNTPAAEPAPHGLVVVGSHVAMTTRQLAVLRERGAPLEVEIDVLEVLGSGRNEHLSDVVDRTTSGLKEQTVVVSTSRTLVRDTDPQHSLHIAREVSAAVVQVVEVVLARRLPRFIVAKGGITSSDVATLGLRMRRAMVRGPMLPGIVSLWEPMDGPAQGVPYVVFAGNVGGSDSLANVVEALSG